MGDMADDLIDQGMLSMWDGEDDECEDGLDSRLRDCTPRPKGPGKCPRCKAPTVMRHGPYGFFYGCSTFPNCKGTRQL